MMNKLKVVNNSGLNIIKAIQIIILKNDFILPLSIILLHASRLEVSFFNFLNPIFIIGITFFQII